MSTYQSVQSAGISDASLVITKPVSLAVGDLMVAGIFLQNEYSGTDSIATPSGWTLYDTQPSTDSNGVLKLFYKVADSADVAASNFTFANSNGSGTTYSMVGHIVRVTSFGIVAGGTKGNQDNVTTYTLTGFTPSRANCLFIAFAANADTTAQTNTSIAMATSNPTWTERAETQQLDSNQDVNLAVYTASRPEATATGDFTVTVLNGGVGNFVESIVIALSETTSGSVTPTTYTNAYAFAPFAIDIGADAITEAPNFSEGPFTPAWTNPGKSSATWTNPDK